MPRTMRLSQSSSSFIPKFTSVFYLALIVVILLVVTVPKPTVGTISVISELTNGTVATINDLPARFIPERFSFYGIQGYLLYADPPDACGKVKPPPTPPVINIEYPINWILLARRSPDCHFQKKIENAQNAGYTAIIIHNVDSNSTEVMGVDDPSKIIIYATFVGEYDGRVLRNYTYGTLSYIRIQDDFSINGYLLPFSIVVGLCFIVMIIFMLWQQVIRCIRERRRSRRRKLPASALKKIPTQKWTKGDPYETCAVCLDDFVEQDKIRVLPCSHGFHMKCIDPWLTKGRRVCPICKRKVIVADERVDRDSDSETDDESAPLLGTSTATTVQTANGEETFVQQGESPEQPQSSQQSPRHTQVLPQVHTRGRGALGFLTSSRQPRATSSTATTSPPSFDSDTSSVTSVSTTGSGRGGGGSPSHHSVLAEVHHSTEVLRQRMEEEHNQNENINSQSQFFVPRPTSCFRDNNSVYVPDLEVGIIDDTVNSNGNENWSQNDFSSPGRNVDRASTDFCSNTNGNPVV